MSILKNRSARILIIGMLSIATIGFVVAMSYYRSANKSVDPRILDARQLYSKYDSYAVAGDYYKLFSLLDSIENIYSGYSHYSSSFEVGVIYNNRAAALITIALHSDSIPADNNPLFDTNRDSVLIIAENYALRSIAYYEAWLKSYYDNSVEEIERSIETDFFSDMENYPDHMKLSYLKSRAKEIVKAVAEADRRLSVSYTNLGVLHRIRGNYVAAAKEYEKALKLWDRNLSAENNLNSLLGRPIKKRNLIQKLFPPERGKN